MDEILMQAKITGGFYLVEEEIELLLSFQFL
jgi:hypothetical protein